MIDVLVERDNIGRWWAYVSAYRRSGERATIGRRFGSSYEAAKWGLANAARLTKHKKELEHDDT